MSTYCAFYLWCRRTAKTRVIVFVIALIGLSPVIGCSTPSYRYVASGPSQPKKEEAKDEASYPVPAQTPEGTVRVRSMGVVDLRRKGEDKRVPSFHVRATLSKTSGVNLWTFNIQEQTLFIPNQSPILPLYANSNSTTLPSFQLKTGDVRSIDLFFPLPQNINSADDVSEFNFKWVIHPDSQILTETTNFQRLQAHEHYPAAYPYDPYPIGYGSLWWGSYGYWGPIEVAPSIRIRK